MMTGAFKDDPQIQLNGQSPVKPDERYYWGASLGGIMGGVYMSITPDVARGGLGVPGQSFNLMLSRSVFVLGTTGDELADRGVAAQVDFNRSVVFPTSKLVTDASIAVEQGAGAWPSNPVIYGGAHVNSVLSRLGPSLPFALSAESLTIGGETFSGLATD